MKKFKKILITSLSLAICCQLSGIFHLVKAYAEENSAQENTAINFQQGTGALEEGATAGLVEGNSAETQNPEINLMPRVGMTASAPLSGPIALNSSPAYDIVINEFMANPIGADPGNEWVELFNKEDIAVNISGWQIYDLAGLRATIADGTVIHNKGYYLVSGISNLDNAGYEEIILKDQTSQLIDSVSYNGTSAGDSRGRFPDGTDNFYQFTNPTPGTANYLGQPTAGTVNDGLGADIDFSNDNSHLSANWSGFSDPIVGLDHYQYAVGTTSGDDDIVSWTVDSLDTSVTIEGLILSEGIYYFSVKAVNKNDIESQIASSDGVNIDITAPEVDDATFNSPDGSLIGPGSEVNIEVFLVNPEAGEAIGTFNGLDLNWQMAIDIAGPFYKASYQVEAGDPSATDAPLQVVVTDRAGNSSLPYNQNSGIEIDTTPPSAPLSISVMAGTNNIKINWSASTSADVVGYNVYRASSPYQKINSSLIIGTSYIDYDIVKGVDYCYKITAVDGVGNETPLITAITSNLISVTAISEVVGQILESGAKVEGQGLIPSAQAATTEGQVEGQEEAIETQPEAPAEEEEESVKNWPMIVAIIIAGLIIVAGVWYYWVVTRPAREYSITSEPRPRRRRTPRKSTRRRPSKRPRRKGSRR